MNPTRPNIPHAPEHGRLDATKGVSSGHSPHASMPGHAAATKRVPPSHVIPATPPPLPPVKALAEGVFSILIAPLRKAVAEEGYTTPTPIQEQAIPHLLEGRDLLGCAQTGTGKTAAFVLPLLQHITSRPRPPVRGRPRALILAPTRELAAQIGESVRAYGRYVPVKYTVIFGGAGQYPQVAALNRGVDVVVATPGRLLDLMGQGHAHNKMAAMMP